MKSVVYVLVPAVLLVCTPVTGYWLEGQLSALFSHPLFVLAQSDSKTAL